MNEFNFTSAICTSRSQSERLLALGLKKETADCYWFYCDIAKEWKCTILSSTQVFKDYPTTVIPAWSLHRLIEMMPDIIKDHIDEMLYYLSIAGNSVFYENKSFDLCQFFGDNLYVCIIDCIEWLINEGYFNKEYLNGND